VNPKVSATASVPRLVLRNAVFLALAQVAGLPLTLLQSALTARFLGPTALGYIYIASSFVGFGFMVVDWGQIGALPALVATNRDRAGRLLGSALVWRSTSALFVSLVLPAMAYLLRYNSQVLIAVFLVSLIASISELSNGCQYAIFGFERTDFAARRQMVEQALSVIVVATVLLLGGKLTVMLAATVAVVLVVLIYVWRTLRAAGFDRLSFDLDTLKLLLQRGTPFVFFGLAMALQPCVDTLFLSKFAADSVGWYAAARKLIGVLVFPAAAVIGAIYPTLCRLHATDAQGFREATNGTLRSMSILAVPIALGCAFFPEIGVAVYSRRAFGPAAGDLRVLSIFLFLMYFSMPIGNCLLAANKQRVWATVQSSCVVISMAFDPLFIRWFQRRSGNGGLGVCWAAVLSEVVVLVSGIILVPRGIFDRRLARSIFLAAVAGCTMTATARGLSMWSPFVVAPIALAAYGATLWLTGGIEKSQIDAVRGLVSRKLSWTVTIPSP
jgi:O-antigen/teichoic acid export membrane protein